MSDVRELLLHAACKAIAFNPSFAQIAGCVKAGLFLSQAMYWQKIVGVDGWFYKTQRDWSEETCLTRTEQETARKVWKMLGILEEKLAGLPATVHYRINLIALAARLHTLQDSCKQAGKNPALADAGRTQASLQDSRKPYKEAEITTENTQEITQREAAATQSRLTERRQRFSTQQKKSVPARPPKRVRDPKPKLNFHEMPKDFVPKESHRLLAKQLGVDLVPTFAEFCDYHRAKGNKFKNWDFALNTWIRREVRYNSNGKGRAKYGNEALKERAEAEKQHNRKIFGSGEA